MPSCFKGKYITREVPVASIVNESCVGREGVAIPAAGARVRLIGACGDTRTYPNTHSCSPGVRALLAIAVHFEVNIGWAFSHFILD